MILFEHPPAVPGPNLRHPAAPLDRLTPRPFRAPAKSFVSEHLQTKRQLRPNPPLSNSCVSMHLQENAQMRPNAPLSNSFRINNVTNSPQKAPLSNSFSLRHFQTSCKAPLSKSFRIKALQKLNVFYASRRTATQNVARVPRLPGLSTAQYPRVQGNAGYTDRPVVRPIFGPSASAAPHLCTRIIGKGTAHQATLYESTTYSQK